MSDLTDQAEQTEQLFRDAAIKKTGVNQLRDKETGELIINTSNPSGECWNNCGEVTGFERRFCDRECADMWSKEFE